MATPIEAASSRPVTYKGVLTRPGPYADLRQRQLLGLLFGVKRTRYAKRRETGKE
jgi:hypothetical protein